MKRLLTISIASAAIAIGAFPALAEVDPKIAEFCLKATDFAGCVQTMNTGIPPKRRKADEERLHTWTRDDGTIVRMRVSSTTDTKAVVDEFCQIIDTLPKGDELD